MDEISKFIRNNSHLDVVIEMKKANAARDRRVFTKCFTKISRYIGNLEFLKINKDNFQNCGCIDCISFLEEAERNLLLSRIPGAICEDDNEMD